MANALVSLLDITKRRGNDQAVGLLEDTITYAPELSAIMGRPIPGTQYKTVHRALPTVGFRQPNNGSDTVKSKYRQSLHECMLLDVQLEADKAVIDAAAPSSPNSPEADIGDLLFDEADAAVRATYIAVGAQVYYGTSSDANGFTGIAPQVGSLNAALNTSPAVLTAAGSTSVSQSSVYFIWENLRGAHFIFGNNAGLTMLPEWRIQQVLGANGKPMTAYVNNVQGWLGFAINHPLSVARICNIQNLTATITHLNDQLVAQLLSYLPLQMLAEVNQQFNTGGPNKWGPGLKMFMNPQTRYGLQISRSPVYSSGLSGITAATQLQFATTPTDSNGIPIVVTNSITNTEAVVT